MDMDIDEHEKIFTIVMTSEKRIRLQQWKIKYVHEGHESMVNGELLFMLFIFVTVVQLGLYEWKTNYFQLYQSMMSSALWVTPFIISIYKSCWSFIVCWTLFSMITGLVVRKAIEKPLQGSTPRLVYKWFYFIYKLSYLVSVGFLIMFAAFCAIIIFIDYSAIWMDYGEIIMLYGLYFGILGEDVAEICTSCMAAHLRYYVPQGMPTRRLNTNICAICGNKLLVKPGEKGIIESTFQLTCGHKFHEFCIRGWCIVGKKQTCPYCKERVDLKRMFRYPWEEPHIVYGKVLSLLRWTVAWGPMLMVIKMCIAYKFGLEVFDMDIEYTYTEKTR